MSLIPVDVDLIDPTTATFSPINASSTPIDTIHGEPSNWIAYGTAVTMRAQVVWGPLRMLNTPTPTPVGEDEPHVGYVMLLRKDMDAKGYTPRRGDKITNLGGETVELYVTRLEWGASRQGKFRLARVHFTDRRGTR